MNQNLIEQYLANEDGQLTMDALFSRVARCMRVIKEEAEVFESECMTDEAFGYQIALLCVCVEQFKERVLEAEEGIEKFEQNTYHKWMTYTELAQELMRLLTARTPEALTKLYKLDRTSNFNVIKVNAQFIDIEYANKSLVPPSTTAVVKPPLSHDTTSVVTPPKLEIFLSPSATEAVIAKTRALEERFSIIQRRIRVYQDHYALLGNLEFLESEHATLSQRMNEIAQHVEDSVIGMQKRTLATIKENITEVDECFGEMREILRRERVNFQQHVYNTIGRFIECSTIYQKLIAHLRLHKVGEWAEETHEEDKKKIKEYCASMYQIREETIS